MQKLQPFTPEQKTFIIKKLIEDYYEFSPPGDDPRTVGVLQQLVADVDAVLHLNADLEEEA